VTVQELLKLFRCSGFQKQDGIQGSMVVRRPASFEPNSHLYDYDLASHVIFVSDWMKVSAAGHFPGLEKHDTFQKPDSILLNGRGRNLVSYNYSYLTELQMGFYPVAVVRQ
jgi:hypothetical protein